MFCRFSFPKTCLFDFSLNHVPLSYSYLFTRLVLYPHAGISDHPVKSSLRRFSSIFRLSFIQILIAEGNLRPYSSYDRPQFVVNILSNDKIFEKNMCGYSESIVSEELTYYFWGGRRTKITYTVYPINHTQLDLDYNLRRNDVTRRSKKFVGKNLRKNQRRQIFRPCTVGKFGLTGEEGKQIFATLEEKTK